MICNLSGLRVEVTEPSSMPIAFFESLVVFCDDGYSGSCDLVLKARVGAPKLERRIFSSNTVDIYEAEQTDNAAPQEAEIFCFSGEKAKCALQFCCAEKQMILWTYPETDLGDVTASDQARVIVRLAFEEYASALGCISLHSSTFVHDGMAISATGVSGAGKSTLTRNWISAYPETYILNGDRPMMRVAKDAVNVYGMPWSGSENIFINSAAPLRAIVEIQQYSENRVFRLSQEEAYRQLIKRVSKPLWNEEAAFNCVALSGRLSRITPFYRLYCVNDVSAAKCLHDVICGISEPSLLNEGDRIVKIKDNFVLRRILDDNIVIPIGADSAAAQGAMMLSDSGAFIWEKLQSPVTRDDLVRMMQDEYDIDEKTAGEDVDSFLDTLRSFRVLEED